MPLAIITVIYKKYDHLKDFFATLDLQTDRDFRVYVVDVSPEMRDCALPEYATRIHAENKGYAHGLNVGYECARADGLDQFMFVNDDVAFDVKTVSQARISISEHPQSLIGGKIYYYPGNEYHTDRYSDEELGKVLWYAGGSIDWNHAQAIHRGVDHVDTGQYDQVEETGFVTGCLMMFDAKLIEKAGKMDGSYFLYFEDADWCEQVKNAGLRVYYDYRVRIWHKNSQSTGGSGSNLHRVYQRRNIVKFGLRYAPIRTKFHLLLNYLRGR